ncbi:MAG TPA: Fic family protein, partial [Streptosporangiaceae bacterium]
TRRDRQPCDYEAYVPDPLVGRRIVLDGSVAAEVTDAEIALARFEALAVAHANTEALARVLLRAESVASSRIEGLEAGPQRLSRAEAARLLGQQVSDVTAIEVLASIDAMTAINSSVDLGTPIKVAHLIEFHRRLLTGSRRAAHGGLIRTQQDWIGGSAHNPCSAAFVPPPPELVSGLLDDLCAFCSDDSLPAVAQAAIAHAQFETIHPFAAGNGRTGRALIHMILRRRGLALRVLPPVSPILASGAQDYTGGLAACRYWGSADSRRAHQGINLWVARFAGVCQRAVADATTFERSVHEIESAWRERLGRVRARSSTDLLIRVLSGAPVITVNSAADLIGRSFPQANNAIERLVKAGVLRQINAGRRNRAFEAPEMREAFTPLERPLARSRGDSITSKPIYPVPHRA